MKELPDFLTVEEAAEILRIGRTAAYEQTRRYEETGGEAGIPVIRVGRLMRVPRMALERWLGGPLTRPEPGSQLSSAPAPPPERSHRRRKPKYPQQGLPLED
jgi:excisionase family DNA binding protein